VESVNKPVVVGVFWSTRETLLLPMEIVLFREFAAPVATAARKVLEGDLKAARMQLYKSDRTSLDQKNSDVAS